MVQDSHFNDSDNPCKQISAVLKSIRECIKEDLFYISTNENRQENIGFIQKFNLNHRKQKEILLAMGLKDFCYPLKNRNPGYEHEILYVFCPQVRLFQFEDTEASSVDIYIKFNLIETEKGKTGNRSIIPPKKQTH